MTDRAVPVQIDVPASYRVPHRGYDLPNGAKIVIVEDKGATLCAAAMGIRVGSHADPEELPGLAHLCEHMLFLGTEENPTEGEYSKFVSQNGGHTNAWTEDGATQYYFTCSQDAFVTALRMFLHFFVCPLFTESSLEREVQAVHSEDEKNHSVDYWCLQEVLKLHAANKAHPHSRYGNGNQRTLWDEPRERGVDVRALLVRFFEQYYVADNACLTLYSPFPAEDLLAVAIPIVERMRRGPRTQLQFGMPPFVIGSGAGQLAPGTWFNLKTNAASQRLRMWFPIPYSHAHFEEGPAKYASHIIGHECEGSLLGVLKAEGLAENLSAGAGHGIDDSHDLFSVSIGLTADGVRRLHTVVERVFQALRHLTQSGVVDAVVDEMRDAQSLMFHVSEIEKPERHAAMLCRHANLYGLKLALSGPYLLHRINKAAFADVFRYLTVDNCLFMLAMQDVDGAIDRATVADGTAAALPLQHLAGISVKTSSTTTHHKAAFGAGQLTSTVLDAWRRPELHSAIATPKPNPFIATNFDTAALATEAYPTTIRTPYGVLYHKRDDRFGVAKSALVIGLESPGAYTSPLHRFFTRVATQMAKLALTETLYFAELGAMECEIHPAQHGMLFQIVGPSHKLLACAQHCLRVMLSRESLVAEDAYRVYAEKVARDLLSSFVSQPYVLAAELNHMWCHRVRWHFTEILEAAVGVSSQPADAASASTSIPPFAQYEEFVVATLLPRVRYEALFFGNSTASMNTEVPQAIEAALAGAKCQAAAATDFVNERTVVQVPRRDELSRRGAELTFGVVVAERVYNAKDGNAAAHVAFQCGIKTPKTRVLADCAMALISSMFFDALRTSETIGYVVGSASKPVDDTMSLVFVAQSAKFGPVYILSRVHAFLAAVQSVFSTLTEDKLEPVRSAQIAGRLDAPKSVADEAARQWARRDHPFGFECKELEVAALRDLSAADVAAFAQSAFSNDSTTARCLVTLLFGDDSSFAEFNDVIGTAQHLDEIRVALPEKATPPAGNEALALPTYGDGALIKLNVLRQRSTFREQEAWVVHRES